MLLLNDFSVCYHALLQWFCQFWQIVVLQAVVHPSQSHHYEIWKCIVWWHALMGVDTIGFWWWCITHRDTGFSDFVHRPDLKLLKTQCFGNWICFRPQVREDAYSVWSLRKSYPQSLVQWLRIVISNPDDGQSLKTQYLCMLWWGFIKLKYSSEGCLSNCSGGSILKIYLHYSRALLNSPLLCV
jgi:hypothetical protein